MKIPPLLTLALVLIACSLSVRGQKPPAGKIPVHLLKEDFRKLRSTLESSQLGLYLYTPKDSMDKVFDRIEGSLDQPMTGVEFYRKVAPLNKYLANLHTVFWPSFAYESGKETGASRFPLDIHWIDGRMYVLRNNSSKEVASGSVIESINGESAASVFRKMLDCTVRDGFNETYPVARLSRNFSFYYDELIGTPNEFKVELTTPDGIAQHVDIPGITSTEIKKNRLTRYGRRYSQYGEDWEAWISDKEPALRLEIEKSEAILTLRTLHHWTISANGQKWDEFLNDAFNKLSASKVTDLIIDMRNNHGGHDILGMLMMSHLHDSAFNYYRKRSLMVKPKGKFRKVGDVYEIIGKDAWTGEVKPASPIFEGKVYVLINSHCASATGEFLGHLKNINRATFIGEEAGGNPVIFMGGQTVRVDLPNTHMTGFVPVSLNEMNVSIKNTGHGIKPDYEIIPGIKNILEEKDVVMEFAHELIIKSRK